jgi:hypothetical protein
VVARLLTWRYVNTGGYSFHPRLAMTFSEGELVRIRELFGQSGETELEAATKR